MSERDRHRRQRFGLWFNLFAAICTLKLRAEGLILGGGSHLLVHGQMSQKSLDFRNAHLSRMALVVEKIKRLT